MRDPWHYLPNLQDFSVMVVNPDSPRARLDYLLEASDYSRLITANDVYNRAGQDYPDERLFWYTSGTTGDSKFYSFSQRQLDVKIATIRAAYDLGPEDHYVSTMPLWHGHGQALYWTVTHAGGKISFVDSSKGLRSLSGLEPTFVSMIPDQLEIVVRQQLPSLRFIRSSSKSLPPSLWHRLADRFRVPVIESFGMTESLSHCFTNPLNGTQKPGTIGLPDGVSARICDQGHLWIKGETCYQPDWFDTGDLASTDQDGYYTILGRHIDQINVHGIKINPISIENQLMDRFQDLEECAVFGRDRLKCVYTGNVSEGTIHEFLLTLGPQCRPRLLQQVDTIPKNGSGKISRQDLENLYV